MPGPFHITTLCPKPHMSVGIGNGVHAAGEVTMK